MDNRLPREAFAQLNLVCHLHLYLDWEFLIMVTHALVISCLDCYNALHWVFPWRPTQVIGPEWSNTCNYGRTRLAPLTPQLHKLDWLLIGFWGSTHCASSYLQSLIWYRTSWFVELFVYFYLSHMLLQVGHFLAPSGEHDFCCGACSLKWAPPPEIWVPLRPLGKFFIMFGA